MEAWAVVGAVLLGVLVGALLPVLAQLFATLRSSRRLLDRLGPKLDATIDEVREAAQRINRAGSGLEAGARTARNLLDTADQFARTLRQLRASMRMAAAVGGAVGPALAAAVRAFAASRAAAAEPEKSTGGGVTETEQPAAEGENA
jgi:ABC-type transporter Mla subunit MlaD